MLRKSPLVRKAELRSKRRKPWRRKEDDKVPDAVGNYVAARDSIVGGCVIAHLEPEHVCHDRFGNVVNPLHVYELDHVDNGGTGNRGASVASNLVRLCPYAHMRKTYMARLYRPMLRDYLRRVEGSCWWDAA